MYKQERTGGHCILWIIAHNMMKKEKSRPSLLAIKKGRRIL
jgi:hypothetical protein